MSIAAILAAKGSRVTIGVPVEAVHGLARRLVEYRIGAIPIVEGDSVVGIVSERDIVRAFAAAPSRDLSGLTAADIMSAPVITVQPGDSISHAFALMTDRRIRHLPVMAAGRLAGIVSIGDLVKRRIEQAEQEALQLKDYIAAG
jgi:CBS domain-containing protein